MGFMMLLVIGVVVIIALKIAHIPRSATVSASFCGLSACLEEIVFAVMMQAFSPLDAVCPFSVTSDEIAVTTCWVC